MKEYFTLTERVILEVLWEQPLDFEDLSAQTNLKNEVLLNSLHLLMIKKAILCNEWTYSIDPTFLRDNIRKINSYKHNIAEIKELVNSAIEYSVEQDNGNFKLQKAELSPKDINSIRDHFKEIEKTISRARNFKNKNNQKVMFYWGHAEYQNIINQALS